MSSESYAQEMQAALRRRQLVRQALIGLGHVPTVIGAFNTAEAVADATDAHLRHTATHSGVLRATWTPAELAVTADEVASDAREVVVGVRWAPAAIDQLAHVLLRLLHAYEAIVRNLADEQPPAPPHEGEHIMHVAGDEQ